MQVLWICYINLADLAASNTRTLRVNHGGRRSDLEMSRAKTGSSKDIFY
jgi:hypothetical protein